MKNLQAIFAVAIIGCVAITDAQANIVTQYSFENNLNDTGASSTVADTLSNAQGGTAAYTAGIVGQATIFDQTLATGSGLLTAADSADLSGTTLWAVDLFVQSSSLAGGFNRLVLKWDTSPFGDLSYHVSINNNGLDLFNSSDGTTGAGFSNPITGAATDAADGVNLNDGAWHHLAISNDASDGAAGLKAWVDGTLVFSGAGLTTFDGNEILGLGDFSDNGAGFNGLMDEVRIHNMAIDQTYVDGRVALLSGPPAIPAPAALPAGLAMLGLVAGRRRR